MSKLPERIGNYILKQEIGRGATSEVWLARHAYLEDRQVAIKILMAQDRETLQRFTREADLAGRLRHPNIVQVLDHGYYSPFHCTIMEYVNGGSLRQLLERDHSLPPLAALAIFKQIAAALDYAHSFNIIHRDVSPGNVLIDQATGMALLTDFGIARGPHGTITVASSIMGTPGFWSPEQSQSAASVTHLSDLFSLGVILYVMLSGEIPWDDTPGLPDRTFAPPIPLKQRGVNNIPGDLDRIIQTLLENDPARRFPTAQAAVEELERIFERHQSPTTRVVGSDADTDPEEDEHDYRYQAMGVASNAVEEVLGQNLVGAPIAAAHTRAAELCRRTVLTNLLDAWAQHGRLRKAHLGRVAHFHKVSSHNVYFYQLRVLYEYRSPPHELEDPDYDEREFPLEPERDHWQVVLPSIQGFEDEPGGQIILPGSARVVSCSTCEGKGVVVCSRCKGKKRISITRKVDPKVDPAAADGESDTSSSDTTSTSSSVAIARAVLPQTERVLVPCPDCEGRGGFTCERCDGLGRLVQRKAFRWERKAYTWDANDDLPDLDEQWLLNTCEAHAVYQEDADQGCRPEWFQVPGLRELAQEAQAATNAHTRIVLSEVTISCIPVTDVVFDLGHFDEEQGDSGLYRLSIYGFENIIPPDWRFLNWERVIFVCVTLFLAVLVLVLGYFAFTG